MTEAMRLLLFPALMAFAASSDLLTMTIPNRVSLIMVAGFAVLALSIGMPLEQIAMHAAAGFMMLVLCFGFFARGWIGGGDAKLAAATALWFGFEHLLDYAIYASLLGGGLTLLILRYRAIPMPWFLAGRDWAERLHGTTTGIPYGIALAAAALLVYPDTSWMKMFAG